MAILTTRVQRFFHLFFLSTTSEKSLIPYKASSDLQTLKICPVRPKVLSSWGITLLEKLRAKSSKQRCPALCNLQLLKKELVAVTSYYSNYIVTAHLCKLMAVLLLR